jgi:hypothetical protein
MRKANLLRKSRQLEKAPHKTPVYFLILLCALTQQVLKPEIPPKPHHSRPLQNSAQRRKDNYITGRGSAYVSCMV